MPNWEVRVYAEDDELIDSWTLHDRTESEADKEAESDVFNMQGSEGAELNFTLTKLNA